MVGLAVLVLGGVIGCSSSSGTGTSPSSSSGSSTSGGTSSTTSSSGTTSSSSGHVCAAPKNTCQKCGYDKCVGDCTTCDGDSACVQAWADYDECVAKLGPGKACTSDPECGSNVACTDGHCPVDDASCLPFVRNQPNASTVYQCFVDSVSPCSDDPGCQDVQPL